MYLSSHKLYASKILDIYLYKTKDSNDAFQALFLYDILDIINGILAELVYMHVD